MYAATFVYLYASYDIGTYKVRGPHVQSTSQMSASIYKNYSQSKWTKVISTVPRRNLNLDFPVNYIYRCRARSVRHQQYDCQALFIVRFTATNGSRNTLCFTAARKTEKTPESAASEKQIRNPRRHMSVTSTSI